MTDNGTPTLSIIATTATTVVIQIDSLAVQEQINVTAGSVTSRTYSVDLLTTIPDTVAQKAVVVTSGLPIMLYIFNMASSSSDGTFVFPETALGTEYIVIGHDSTLAGTEAFLIVGTEAGTTVEIVPPGGVPETHNLNRMDTLLRSGAGLSGTIINATAKVSLLSGHTCANVPDNSVVYCDYIDEQLPPIHSQGKVFVVGYMHSREDFTVGVAASKPNTVVNIYDDTGVLSETINMAGGSATYRTFYGMSLGSVISNEPILVTQYGHGSSLVFGDPSMALVPPIEAYGTKYEFSTVSGYTSSFSAIVPRGMEGSLLLDGISFLPIATALVTVPQIGIYVLIYQDVADGMHTLSFQEPVVPFAAWAYGRTTSAEVALCLGMLT